MRLLPTALLAISLAGCATKGDGFLEHAKTLPTLPADQGRVIVFWDEPSKSVLTNEVVLFGKHKTLGLVYQEGFNVFDLPAGEHSMDSAFVGFEVTCRVHFDLKAGETQYYRISFKPAANPLARAFVHPFVAGALAPAPTCAHGALLQAIAPGEANQRLVGLRYTAGVYQHPGDPRTKPRGL